MKRHELREEVFKILFMEEFYSKETMPNQIELFFRYDDKQEQLDEANMNYITERYWAVNDKESDIDRIISENTEKWDITRIGRIERCVLRLAVYELLYDENIPNAVAIDEAVEIAKTYGQENSGSFVNAILSKIVKTI